MNLVYNCLLVLSYGVIGNALYFEFNYGVFSRKKYYSSNYSLFNYGTMLGLTLGIFHVLYAKNPQDYF